MVRATHRNSLSKTAPLSRMAVVRPGIRRLWVEMPVAPERPITGRVFAPCGGGRVLGVCT